MKHKISVSLLVVVLLSLTVLSSGCGLFYQPGKTAEEVNREHIRLLRLNQQELMRDVDRTLDLDQPRHLTELRIEQ